MDYIIKHLATIIGIVGGIVMIAIIFWYKNRKVTCYACGGKVHYSHAKPIPNPQNQILSVLICINCFKKYSGGGRRTNEQNIYEI